MSRHLVVITAGVSEPSSTRLLADQLSDATRAAVSARGEEVDVRVIEVRELARDLATVMTTGVPTPALTAAKDAVAEADGVIAVSPVFTASYSGLFKMFVDALDPDTLTGVPVMVAATAGTPATRWCSITLCGPCSRICARRSSRPVCSPRPRTSGPRNSPHGSGGPRPNSPRRS
ncbi:hypothetical protein TPAU25S_01819 [Tsukamurella paurometabola]